MNVTFTEHDMEKMLLILFHSEFGYDSISIRMLQI